MYAQDDRALKFAAPKTLTSAFRNGGLEFGSIFATDSPDRRAERGTRFLKYNIKDGSWRDLFTTKAGVGIVSFVSYGKAISSAAALALCKKSCGPNDVLDGHTIRPIVSQSSGSELDDADLMTLAKRRMTPEQRRDELIQSVRATLHSRFDKKRR